MRAGAGAQHDGGFAAPVRALGELAGMQHRALEILDGRNRRNVRHAADAGGEHDVLRVQRARRVALAAHRRLPRRAGVVIGRAFEGGAGPEVEIHALDIGFEPVGDLVLRNVIRPRHRERHVAQVIHRRLVVQLEAVVAQTPVVADALLLVDDQRVEAEPLQFDRRRDAGMTAADDQHVGFAILVGEMLGALVEPACFGEIAGM